MRFLELCGLTVRKDGFKLEMGGELFKGVFANFSKLE